MGKGRGRERNRLVYLVAEILQRQRQLPAGPVVAADASADGCERECAREYARDTREKSPPSAGVPSIKQKQLNGRRRQLFR